MVPEGSNPSSIPNINPLNKNLKKMKIKNYLIYNIFGVMYVVGAAINVFVIIVALITPIYCWISEDWDQMWDIYWVMLITSVCSIPAYLVSGNKIISKMINSWKYKFALSKKNED